MVQEWNRTEAPYPARWYIHGRFEALRRTPEAVAVVDEDRELTYGESDRRAYLPLDAGDSRERLLDMVQDSAPGVLLDARGAGRTARAP